MIKSEQAAKRLREYTVIHLAGGVAQETNEIAIELLENRAHPDRNPRPQERAEFLLKLAREKLDYIAQGVADLRELEKAGSLV